MSYQLYKRCWVYMGAAHTETRLSAKECRALLRKGGWLVHNTYDFDCGTPTQFWHVIKDSFGGMEELSSKMRNQVRRSMSHYVFRPISREELLEKGYPIHAKAAASYRVKAKMPTKEEFVKQTLHSVENEFWGVFDKEDGHLAAFAKNIVTAEACDYSVLKADPDELTKYPYYGLIYSMNEHYLQQRGLRYVNDGARSITNHSNIQSFLTQKFHFRQAYCHLRVVYAPWLKVGVSLLYPFRRHIPIPLVRILLSQEEMARG